jgi:hypothetical protein
MGAVWLYDLPDVLAAGGLTVDVWPGWENRARGSGGYDAVRAVFAHHTASNTSPASDMSFMWDSTSGDQPIGAVYLARDGTVTVGAAGATNTQGKGGPWTLSTGTIPKDAGNGYGIAVEAANAGTGEPWPVAQCDAYTAVCGALCAGYGLDPARDVLSHWEWCEPSCPGRKIDPAGPSPWAAGADRWDMAAFRTAVVAGWTLPPPLPPEVPDMTDEQAAQLAAVHAALTAPIYGDRFTDPAGVPLSVPWAVGWTWDYVSLNIDAKLADIISRLDALEG